MSTVTLAQDAHLVDTAKKVESIVSRLRMRAKRPKVTFSLDPNLSLVDKARLLKLRASGIARRVQVDKSDETASTFESMARSGEIVTAEDSEVTWYNDGGIYEVYGEI